MGFVEDLENSIDIVELVSKYAKLKKTGANYKALCPFPGHSEKTPSFVISPAKQIAYCFGCHKGGGPVKFITDMENCEFREAIQILGNLTGREIQGFSEDKEKIEIKKNLYSLYKDAQRYYTSALNNNPEVKKYLFDRNLTAEDITKFGFGYADSGINLYNALKEKGYDEELIKESQIFIDVSRKKDKFIGRVIFPIINQRGDCVAFAGRILGKGEPKYLNSPASKIYDKSSILYGLFYARQSITKKDRVIISEGYMDAIALHRANFSETVAVSGTALTDKHITIIKRLSKKIYLCFDSDKAGIQATKNSIENLKNKGLEVKIITLPSGKDPDEFLTSGGDFEERISKALSPIAFLIQEHQYDLSSLDEKKKFLAEILESIKSYSDSIEQDMYLKEVARLSDVPLELVYQLFKKTKSQIIEQESVPVKQQSIGARDILCAYILLSENLEEVFEQYFLFPEQTPKDIAEILKDKEKYISKLTLERKSLYKALLMKEEEIAGSNEQKKNRVKELTQSCNREIYKSQVQQLKDKMKSGSDEAFQQYAELLALAKKHHLK